VSIGLKNGDTRTQRGLVGRLGKAQTELRAAGVWAGDSDVATVCANDAVSDGQPKAESRARIVGVMIGFEGSEDRLTTVCGNARPGVPDARTVGDVLQE
jgi:hypothetical protein